MTEPARKSESTEHAPGPWRAQERHPAGVHWDTVIRSASRDPVCSVYAAGWDRRSHRANARLIAAAPELLEAAKCALADMERWRSAINATLASGDLTLIASAVAETPMGPEEQPLRAAIAKANQ